MWNTSLVEYFALESTVGGWLVGISSRWATIEQAKADMPNHADWFRPKGTGTIYKVNINVLSDGQIEINREKIYQVK